MSRLRVICTRTGKRCYGALGYALADAQRLSMRVYRCEFCGCWHLTSHAYDVRRRSRTAIDRGVTT